MTNPAAARDRSWELALACARYAAGFGPASDVAQFAAAIADWPRALDVAREQGLGALLARALEEAQAPAHIREGANRAIATSVARTLGQIRLLARVFGALDDLGVPALPYKGPVLSQQLYGDATLRSSVDLDIVVPRDAYGRARAALVQIGLPPRRGYSLRQERTLFRWLGQASFGEGAEDFIELHWRFAPVQFPFALSPEQALARPASLRIAGRSMPTMSTDDLVVTLAMHAARHLFERLEWLAGIARLLLARPDAPALLAHADRLHARRMLLVTAGVAMRVLDTPLGPEWKIALADDPESERLVAMMSEMTPAGAADEASALGGAKLQRLYARLLDSRVDRVVSIIRAAIMPTEREWEAIALPDALTPLYYVLRPARVIAMYGSRALRRAPT